MLLWQSRILPKIGVIDVPLPPELPVNDCMIQRCVPFQIGIGEKRKKGPI